MESPKPYGVIYRIRCLVNGKLYHGQTRNLKKRKAGHFRENSHCHALRNAIKKHGRQNFVFEVIASAFSERELDQLECQWVATSMVPVGYNLKDGGANPSVSDETRRKMSAASKEAQNRPEVKRKNSAGVKRAWKRPGAREKWRASLKEAFSRPECKERRSQAMKEVHARPGDGERRGESIQASWAAYSPEERRHRLEQQANAYTPECRKRIGERAKRVLARPDVAEKHRNGVRRSVTPERLAAKSAQMREVHARPDDKEKRGASISKAHNTPEGKLKLARRRRRGESVEAWQARISKLEEA